MSGDGTCTMSRAVRRAVCVPVTALAFARGAGDDAQEYLLSGEDTQLKVYDASGALRLAVPVFSLQAIHGLCVSAGVLFAWGARCVAVCPLPAIQAAMDDPDAAVPFERAEARDWVFDVVPRGDGSGVLVTAHNEVVEVAWGSGLVFGRVMSPSRPILYAASARWLGDGRVLVVGGTVFGEILVWTCSVESGECKVLQVLAGHEGSIFGVTISDEMVIGGKAVRLLASCSDDRTIRVWDISDAASEGADGHANHFLHEARETGFGSSAPPREGYIPKEPIAVAMGHVSRIWHVKFQPLRPGPAPSAMQIYSFGEDSTAQLWKLDLAGYEKGTATLSHWATFSNHDGKHIWASAISLVGDGGCRVATGGADGKISLIEVGGALDGSFGTPSLATISHETLPLLTSPQEGGKRGRNRHDMLQRYAFITEDTLLATTRSGKLLVGSFERGITWSEVAVDVEHIEDVKMCSVVTSPRPGIAVLGTTTKALYLYADGRLSRLADAPGKVLNLIHLVGDGESTTFLVTVHGNPEIRILTVKLSTRDVTSNISLLGVDERFVLTSAAQFHGYLVIGSRSGFMEVFTVENDVYTRVTQIAPRADDTVTSIHALPGQIALPIFFLTTNRDGKYRIFELDAREGCPPAVNLRHETSPPFGPLVEDAWFRKGDDGHFSLILSGFRSKDYVVWDETAKEYIASVDCGGGHRVFAHTKGSTTRLRFAFTKSAIAYVHSQARAPCRTLKAGSHGREVRAIAGTEAFGGSYLATGSEDTYVRIWQRLSDPRGKPLRCVASMKLHTAGLQAVKWCDDRLLTSGGNEELFVWRVSALPAGLGLGVFCEAALRDRSPDGDLRIMDLDVCEDATGLVVTVVFSNSVFKTYQYEAPAGADREGTFHEVAKGEYTGACLTQVRRLGGREGALSDVLTASTDGHIALWRPVDGAFVLTCTSRVHQSSIKSLDLRAEDGGYAVITTGDDNALGVTSLSPGHDGSLAVAGRTLVRSAHAAAINGVVGLPGGRVATVSNDQRVKIWRVGGGASPSVDLLEDLYSGVADAGAADYLPRRGELIVSGVGMEIWGVNP